MKRQPPTLAEEGAVSVIVVINSSQGGSDLVLQRIDTVLRNARRMHELIVVDDHAPEGVVARAQLALQRCDARSRLIRLRNAHGYTAALRQAIVVARHPNVALFSGALRYPPEALPELLRRLSRADIVLADGRGTTAPTRWRTPYAASSSAKLYALTPNQRTRVAQAPRQAIERIDLEVESGLKVARREVFDRYAANLPDATTDLELLASCLLDGYRVVSVPVKALISNEQEGMRLRQDLLLQALRLKLAQATRATPMTAMEREQADTADRDLRQITNTLTLPVVRPGISNANSLPQPVREAVARFSQRLAVDRTQDRSGDARARAAYTEQAMQPIYLRKSAYRTFAPIRRLWSAARTLTIGQSVGIVLLVMAMILSILLAPITTAGLIIAAISVFYCVDMGVMFLLVSAALTRPMAQTIDDRVARSINPTFWPSYTILCPLYHEVAVVPQYVEAMRLLDYPHDRLQVLLLTEEDDRQTRAALEAMYLPSNFEIVVVPDGQPRTKPRACNYGLLRATGEYIVIYDAEDIPDPLQLKKAALMFADHGPNVACVQAKLNFYNPVQNLLTRWFTAEYSLWFDLTLPALQRIGTFIPLGGTSNHFRTAVLRRVGGWDPFNVTEDCDLGVRLRQYGYATTILDSTTYEEANSNLHNWLRQRSRWIKGYMQTYLIHMRRPWRYLTEGRLQDFIWLQLFVGGRSATLLINPIMWLLLLLYILFRPVVAPTYAELYPRFILYIAAGSLIFGNFLFLYSQLIGCIQRKQYGLAFATLLIPIYWALMSFAAYIAFYQLLTKPHYWEKTQHGLHLRVGAAQRWPFERRARPTPGVVDAGRQPSEKGNEKGNEKGALRDADEIALDQQETTQLTAFRRVSPALPADAPAAVVAAVGAAAAIAARSSIAALETELLPAVPGRTPAPASQPTPDLVASHLAGPLANQRSSRWMKKPDEYQLPLSYIADMLSTVPVTAIAAPEKSAAYEAPRQATVRALAANVTQPPQLQYLRRPGWLRDGWLIATLCTAICASLLSLWYSYTNGDIMLYNDSYSHLRIARRVLISSSPGIAQFGGVWLPLPHIIQLPFVWNDTLWFSGLAGSFSSMPCYVVAAVYLFLTARRLTH
ncbi:MAG TPA: glycosyltransferase, partial [Ktedonobacterales bacterium]|nr:glycosyltransferase [Ktedonobacterales bacterium]